MGIYAIYESLRILALAEFEEIVVQATIWYLPTGDPHKLRLILVDGSLMDVILSASGRYSYHWDRRLTGRTAIYRYDNAPHAVWHYIATFPHHFHDGEEKNVVASYLSLEPTQAMREFCSFARQKLIEEAES